MKKITLLILFCFSAVGFGQNYGDLTPEQISAVIQQKTEVNQQPNEVGPDEKANSFGENNPVWAYMPQLTPEQISRSIGAESQMQTAGRVNSPVFAGTSKNRTISQEVLDARRAASNTLSSAATGLNNPTFVKEQTVSHPRVSTQAATAVGVDFPLYIAPAKVVKQEMNQPRFYQDPIEIQRELDASALERSQNPSVESRVSEGPQVINLAAIIPNAGATESFAVSTGDFFYDPTDGVNGGPGGDCTTTSSGDPGDYPNRRVRSL